MKTKIIVFLIFLLLGKVPAQALDISQFQRLIALLNILDKEKKQLVQQKALKKSSEAIKANTHASLEVHRHVEELLRNVDEFARIRGANGKAFQSVVAWIQITKEITHNVSVFVNNPALQRVDEIINAGASGKKGANYTANELYSYFFDVSDVQARIQNYTDYEIGKMSETDKLIGFQTALQKKKIATAMAYYQAADELYTQAITLSNAISNPNQGTPLHVSNEGLFGFGGPFADNSDLSDPFSLISETSGIGGFFKSIIDFFSGILGKDGNTTYKIGGGWSIYTNADDWDGEFDGFTGQKKGLRMTIGERLSAQKEAMDMMTKAMELREKADRLLEEATQKTPLQKAHEAARVNDFMRSAAARMDISM